MSDFDDFLRELEEEMAIKYHLPTTAPKLFNRQAPPGSSKSHANVVSNY
jgi:hypothetical protein